MSDAPQSSLPTEDPAQADTACACPNHAPMMGLSVLAVALLGGALVALNAAPELSGRALALLPDGLFSLTSQVSARPAGYQGESRCGCCSGSAGVCSQGAEEEGAEASGLMALGAAMAEPAESAEATGLAESASGEVPPWPALPASEG